MNAETKVEKPKAEKPAKANPNVAIWDALSKTDPRHTKPFSRAGGFKGTAIKPIWIVKRLTEQFGACGEGWGIGEPRFDVVPSGDEILVYCTVACWHTRPTNTLYGVGGDRVRGKNKNGPFSDDEAFKKAFTDAVSNAFKFIGVAADIHMGLFDDSKYVREVAEEFAEHIGTGETKPARPQPLDGPYKSKTALWKAVREFVHTLNGIDDLGEFEGFLQTDEVVELLDQCKRDAPQLLDTGEGLPEEYEPLLTLIGRLRNELRAEPDDSWKRNPIMAG